MRSKTVFILLLMFFFSHVVFAQGTAHVSGNIFKKASQAKTLARTAAGAEEKIDIIFYPDGKDAGVIDLSFFDSRNIEYIKSRSFLSARVPAGDVALLGQIKGVKYIDLNVKAKALETVSEGRSAVNASVYFYNGVGGAGVNIAVIDIGFASYNYLQTAGELPRNLITKDFTRSGEPTVNPLLETERHGSACAEIIYDFVPQSQMYLLKVSDAPSIQNAFDYCKSQNIKIASCSIGFSEGFWCDGTGVIAKIATDAYNDGILPVVAAGNEAEQSWFGVFNGNFSDMMVFPSGKDYLEVNMYPYGEAYLMWDDFTAKNKKYTLYMYDSAGNVLLDSSVWSAGDNPSVYVTNNLPSGKSVRLKIKKENIDPGVNIRLYFRGNYINSADKRPESSLSSPADSREAISVAAMSVSRWGSGPIDRYSSHGPARQTLTLPQAQKPDITGPSYVTTLSYGNKVFNGTSAATPHIAGSAAMLLSLDRTMSVSQLKSKVLSYYQQIESSPDNIYGRGKLVLGDDMLPSNSDAGDIVCYPNPSSIGKNGHVKITNLPYNTALIDINIYTVTGEFVRSFGSSDMKPQNGKMTIEWDLKNQSGSNVAPGVYFFTINTPVSGKKVKKIAIQK